MPDELILPVLVIAGLLLLIAVGLGVDAVMSRRGGRQPVLRQRPRFVQSIIRATIARRRKDPDDTRSGPKADDTRSGPRQE